MGKFSVLAFSVGLIALAGIGLSTNAMATSHNQAAGSSDLADSAKKAEGPSRGLLMPYINPARGRKLFASKGCVVCHSINGIGGEDAPSMDAKNMPAIMNPFDFAAMMWRGAATMIAMQEDELGEQIEFSGNELADIIGFVHSIEEQKKFSDKDIPPRIEKLLGHLGNETEEHEKKEHN